MQIEALSLSNFRIFTRLEMDFPDRLTLLVGNNAQGKTSVLEAVHFLSILTSPLASNDRELINLLTVQDELPVGRLVGRVRKQEKTHTIEVRLILNTIQNGNQRLRKEVLINGVKKRLFDAVGFFNSVLFLPQMTRILEDGPDERRGDPLEEPEGDQHRGAGEEKVSDGDRGLEEETRDQQPPAPLAIRPPSRDG